MRVSLEFNANDVLVIIASLELNISTYGQIGEDYRSELIALKQNICLQLKAQNINKPEDLLEG
jgi:hypothetical protein